MAIRNKVADVSIVGEVNPDLIVYGLPRELPEERELLASGFTMTLGSSSAILAHNLSLLGTPVHFFSRVGLDALGEMCCAWLRQAGIDTGRIVRSTSNTGVTLILPLKDTRRILTYPGTTFELGIGDIDIEQVASASHFHLSSLFLHRKLSPDIPSLFFTMKQRGLTTSLDTNDDPEGKWEGVLHDILPIIDLLLCTEQELTHIAGTSDPDAAARRMANTVPTLVVKRGPRGASAYADGKRIDIPALRVSVIDTVGAGDTFDAGFLHQWVRKAPLETCLAYGNITGALSVTRPGGTAAFQDAAYRKQFLTEHWQGHRLR